MPRRGQNRAQGKCTKLNFFDNNSGGKKFSEVIVNMSHGLGQVSHGLGQVFAHEICLSQSRTNFSYAINHDW